MYNICLHKNEYLKYYSIAGNQDFVRCFHCGIGLRNWEEDDDPYVEHGRWSPNCQYIKNRKGQEFIDAVQEAVRKVQLVRIILKYIKIY